MRKGESLGGLVSKLGCNLHKSPGVIGSRTTKPRKDGGGIREQRKGGEWGTEHPAPLHFCPGKKTPVFSKPQFLTVTISSGTFTTDSSPAQDAGLKVKTWQMSWGFVPD